LNDPASASIVATRTTRQRRVVEEVETVEQVAVAAGDWQQHWPNLPQPWITSGEGFTA
jgi:hypothetical protein